MARKIGGIAVAVIAGLAGITACTSTHQRPATLPTATTTTSTAASPSPPSPTPTAETPDSAKQHAIDAYVGMQNAFLEASKRGDPSFPDLAKYATGQALSLLTNGLKSYQAKGLLGRGQASYHPRIQSLAPPGAPTKASVIDCMNTSDTSLYKANGEPYQDDPGGFRLVLADVQRLNGVWKVTSVGVRAVGTCTV